MNPLDEYLFDRINRVWSSPYLDHLMPVVSSFDIWKPLLLIASIAVAFTGGRRGRIFLLTILLGIGLGDGLVSHTIKHGVDRSRPRDVREGTIVRGTSQEKPRWLHAMDPPEIRVTCLTEKREFHGNSFPSSHVINLVMVATVSFYYSSFAGWMLSGVSLLVAWSRIYCGAHWPTDIPPSILIGILCGLLSLWIVARIEEFLDRRGDRPG